jgi:hypothetical protein
VGQGPTPRSEAQPSEAVRPELKWRERAADAEGVPSGRGRTGEAIAMDVGAVSSGRTAFEAVRTRMAELEPGPILVARTGLPPLEPPQGTDQEDLLRSGLRERSLLRDLDPVLSQRDRDGADPEAAG